MGHTGLLNEIDASAAAQEGGPGQRPVSSALETTGSHTPICQQPHAACSHLGIDESCHKGRVCCDQQHSFAWCY